MPKVTSLGHAGLYARNPQHLAAFYCDLLGLRVVAAEPDGSSSFLGAQPPEAEHHDLAIFSNPVDRHLAFRVASLADLRVFYHAVQQRGLVVEDVWNYGVAIAFYIADPEGNRIELYWPTGFDYPGIYGVPIDLGLTDAEVLEILERGVPE
ncbi:MAG: VOC family protein [Chloroflexota bacterium]